MPPRLAIWMIYGAIWRSGRSGTWIALVELGTDVQRWREEVAQTEGERPRALLISFAPGIGDVVIMEPLIRSIRRYRPEWMLTIVGREFTSDLLGLDGCRLISPFYFVAEAPAALRPLQRFIPQRLFAKAAEPAINMGAGGFDRVINLFWIWETTVPFELWWTPQWPTIEGVKNAVDLLADSLQSELGIEIPYEERLPRLDTFPDGECWAEQYLMDQSLLHCPTAAIVVSADNPLKWWEVDKWADLNDWLIRMGWRTIMVAPREHLHARRVFDTCVHKPLWPVLDLRKLVALLARIDLVVGIDTGPLHIAGALGKPWVGIFGPSNPDLIGPYDRSRGRAIVARFSKPPSCKDCWTCFKGWGGKCLTLPKTGCTTMIPVEEVVDAILSVCCGTPFAS